MENSTIKSSKELEEEIVSEFSLFDEWLDKYEYIIELGKSLPIIPEKDKTDSNLINGCQSRVWLSSEYRDGRVYFKADSDAIITKGIISLLIRVYNGQTPEEILNSDFSFIEKIGLKENLSPTRANGLLSMIKQIKMYALAYEAENNNKEQADYGK
ncbi:MAG: SufE family protein [Bacteroidales bacterium]|nr:SufE family protein [Bacteroidales bacterium]MDD4670732.1 SufE family protein [Bacteroidales bacterium]